MYAHVVPPSPCSAHSCLQCCSSIALVTGTSAVCLVPRLGYRVSPPSCQDVRSSLSLEISHHVLLIFMRCWPLPLTPMHLMLGSGCACCHYCHNSQPADHLTLVAHMHLRCGPLHYLLYRLCLHSSEQLPLVLAQSVEQATADR